MRVPIACTLTADEQPNRVEEWRAFFATHVAAAELSPATARLRLNAGDEAVLVAADLVLREKQCCAFFDFTIRLDGDGRWLLIAIPDDAAPVLADLVGLLPPALRSPE